MRHHAFGSLIGIRAISFVPARPTCSAASDAARDEFIVKALDATRTHRAGAALGAVSVQVPLFGRDGAFVEECAGSDRRLTSLNT